MGEVRSMCWSVCVWVYITLRSLSFYSHYYGWSETLYVLICMCVSIHHTEIFVIVFPLLWVKWEVCVDLYVCEYTSHWDLCHCIPVTMGEVRSCMCWSVCVWVYITLRSLSFYSHYYGWSETLYVLICMCASIHTCMCKWNRMWWKLNVAREVCHRFLIKWLLHTHTHTL